MYPAVEAALGFMRPRLPVTALCDLPGFLETRGCEISIANAANIRHIATIAHSIKIFFLLNYDDLRSKAQSFVKSIQQLQQLFGGLDGLNSNMGSVLIGITRAGHQSLKKIAPFVVQEAAKHGWVVGVEQVILVDPLDAHEECTNAGEIMDLVAQLEPICHEHAGTMFTTTLTAEDNLFIRTIADKTKVNADKYWEQRNFKGIAKEFRVISALKDIHHAAIVQLQHDLQLQVKSLVEKTVESVLLIAISNTVVERMKVFELMRILKESIQFEQFLDDESTPRNSVPGPAGFITKSFYAAKQQVEQHERVLQQETNDRVAHEWSLLSTYLSDMLLNGELEPNEQQGLASLVRLVEPAAASHASEAKVEEDEESETKVEEDDEFFDAVENGESKNSENEKVGGADSARHRLASFLAEIKGVVAAPRLEVIERIQALSAAMEAETALRAKKYYCGDLVPLSQLQNQISKKYFGLLEAVVSHAAIAQARLELATALELLKAASEGVIDKNYEFYALNQLRPNQIGLLSMNGFDPTAVGSVQKGLSSLRARLSKREFVEHLDEVKSVLLGIHEVATQKYKVRRLERLIAHIKSVNVQVVAPEMTLQLNKWFAQLHEIDPATHRHMCVTMEERFIKRPLSGLNEQTEQVIGALDLRDLEQGTKVLCARSTRSSDSTGVGGRGNMSVSQLRALITSSGHPKGYADCSEKSELQQRAREALELTDGGLGSKSSEDNGSSVQKKITWLIRAGFDRKLIEWVFRPGFENVFAGFNSSQILAHRAAFESLVIGVTKREHQECLTKSLRKEILQLLQPKPGEKTSPAAVHSRKVRELFGALKAYTNEDGDEVQKEVERLVVRDSITALNKELGTAVKALDMSKAKASYERFESHGFASSNPGRDLSACVQMLHDLKLTCRHVDSICVGAVLLSEKARSDGSSPDVEEDFDEDAESSAGIITAAAIAEVDAFIDLVAVAVERRYFETIMSDISVACNKRALYNILDELPHWLTTLQAKDGAQYKLACTQIVDGLTEQLNQADTLLVSQDYNKLFALQSSVHGIQKNLVSHDEIFKHLEKSAERFAASVDSHTAELLVAAHKEFDRNELANREFFAVENVGAAAHAFKEMENKGYQKGSQLKRELVKKFRERWDTTAKTLVGDAKKGGDRNKLSARTAQLVVKNQLLAQKMGDEAYFKSKVKGIFAQIDQELMYFVGESMQELGRTNAQSEQGDAAMQIIGEFKEFKQIDISLFNQKAGSVKFETSLARLRTHPSGSCDNVALEAGYAFYKARYEEFINDIVAEAKAGSSGGGGSSEGRWITGQTKLIQGLVKKLSGKVSRGNWSALSEHRVETCSLLAAICAVWTYISSASQFKKGDSATLLQPHGAQILTVMRLLGLGSTKLTGMGSMNHLAQVSTGEGKSISLGFLAAMFALFGVSVHVVCFSPYLSQRDHNAFKGLFAELNVENEISYVVSQHLERPSI
jgi:hypothetical protein